MIKKIIRLTENDLHNIIRATVLDIINEEKNDNRKLADENPNIQNLKTQIEDLQKQKRKSEDTDTTSLTNQIDNLKDRIETEYAKYEVNSKYVKGDRTK